MTHTYHITGMTCAGCQYKVEHLLKHISGVENAEVDLERGEATVTMNHHIATADFQQALQGYPKYQLSDSPVNHVEPSVTDETNSMLQTYKPIFLIFAYVLIVSLIVGTTVLGFDWMLAMRTFMAGFFLVFSFFKMLNLDAFADSYAMYDVIARRFKGWGYLYALLELALGLAYTVNFNPVITNAVTLVVMLVSIVGVLQSVLNQRAIRCACLGSVFNLPMSTITIIEDGLMICMSAFMLFQYI